MIVSNETTELHFADKNGDNNIEVSSAMIVSNETTELIVADKEGDNNIELSKNVLIRPVISIAC